MIKYMEGGKYSRKLENLKYRSINSAKSPASDTGDVSEPRLISQVGRVRQVVFAFVVAAASRAVEM